MQCLAIRFLRVYSNRRKGTVGPFQYKPNSRQNSSTENTLIPIDTTASKYMEEPGGVRDGGGTPYKMG